MILGASIFDGRKSTLEFTATLAKISDIIISLNLNFYANAS